MQGSEAEGDASMPNLVWQKMGAPIGPQSGAAVRAVQVNMSPMQLLRWPFFNSPRPTRGLAPLAGVGVCEYHCAYAVAYLYAPARYPPQWTGFPWGADGKHVLYYQLPIYYLQPGPVTYPPDLSLLLGVSQRRLWVPPWGEVAIRHNREAGAAVDELGRKVLSELWLLAGLAGNASDALPATSSVHIAQASAAMLLAAQRGGAVSDIIAAGEACYPSSTGSEVIARLAHDLGYALDGRTEALMYLLGVSWLEAEGGARLPPIGGGKWGHGNAT